MDRNAWGTPPAIIEMARDLMGSIDLDPASNAKAQETVRAQVWCGFDHPLPTNTNALLVREWPRGNVWLNPPYGRGLVMPFVTALMRELNAGRAQQACVLVNATVETEAGQLLLSKADAVWFPDHRIRFLHPETNEPTPGGAWPQMLCYFNPADNVNAKLRLNEALTRHNLKGVVR